MADDVPPAPEEEPTVLMVGEGEPLEEALLAAMERHGLAVERATITTCAQTAVAVAPDLLLLIGDAGRDGGIGVLDRLSGSPLAAVVPVVLLADDDALGQRLTAFRFGATAVVQRSASADAIATRVSELAREIPDRSSQSAGELGEATLDEFADLLRRELRNGILSVKGGRDDDTVVRLVLGEGKQVASLVEGFVDRVRPLIRSAEVLHYEFEQQPGGTLKLLGADSDDEPTAASIEGMRILLADDDVTRADAVAQELRSRGASVVMTDLAGSRIERARVLDPAVLIIDEAAISEEGYQLVRRMREDMRLRWAYLLVVSWDEIWSDEARGPVMSKLVSRVAQLGSPERDVRDRVALGRPFDTRLEAVGPARLLRALVEDQQTLRVTIHNRRALVAVDVTEGLVAGARTELLGEDAAEALEGPLALAALLAMATGRVHVEPALTPALANVMATLDFALNTASGEEGPFRPSQPVSRPYEMPDGDRPALVGSLNANPRSQVARGGGTVSALVAPPGDSTEPRRRPPRPASRPVARKDNTIEGIPAPPATAEQMETTGEVTLPELQREPTAPGGAPPVLAPPAPKINLAGLGKGPALPSRAGSRAFVPKPPGAFAPRPPRAGGAQAPAKPPAEEAPPPLPVEGIVPAAAMPEAPFPRAGRTVDGTGQRRPRRHKPTLVGMPTSGVRRALEQVGRDTRGLPAPHAEEAETTELETPTSLEEARTAERTAPPEAEVATREVPLLEAADEVATREVALPDAQDDALDDEPTRTDGPVLPPEEAPMVGDAQLLEEAAPAGFPAVPVPPPPPPPAPPSVDTGPSIEIHLAPPALDTGPSVEVNLDTPAAPPEAQVPPPIPAPVIDAFDAAALPAAALTDHTYKLPTSGARRRTSWIIAGSLLLLVATGAGVGVWIFADDEDDVVAVELPETGTPGGPADDEGTTAGEPDVEPADDEGTTAGEPDVEPAGDEGTTAAEPDVEPAGDEGTTAAEPDVEPAGAAPSLPEGLPELSVAVELPEVPTWVERLRPRDRRIRARQLRGRGRRLMRQRRHRQALSHFRQSLQHEPDSPEGAKGMGLLLHRMGEAEESLAWIRRTVELAPENDNYWVLLGDALGSRGDVPGARRAWERALELNGRNRPARRRLERINHRAGR